MQPTEINSGGTESAILSNDPTSGWYLAQLSTLHGNRCHMSSISGCKSYTETWSHATGEESTAEERYTVSFAQTGHRCVHLMNRQVPAGPKAWRAYVAMGHGRGRWLQAVMDKD